VASQGGVNFYIGNTPQSNGMQAVVPGTHESWWGGFQDTRAIAERAAGRALKPSEVSSYWFRKGLAFIRDEPGKWFALTLKKAALFVGNVEIPNNEPYEAHRKNYISLRVIPLGFGLLLGLFAVGLPRMVSSRFGRLVVQFLLAYAVTTIAFFVTGRYRAPLVPLVIAGAALGVVAIWDAIRSRRLTKAAAMVALAAAVTGILSIDYFEVRRSTAGFTAYTDALDLLESGRTDQAIAALEAIRRGQSVKAPELYLSLARAYISRGRPEDAPLILSVTEDGLSSFPTEPELLWYSAIGHVGSREWDPARDRIERYLAERPDDLKGLHLAFTIAGLQGRTEDARGYFARAQAINPADPLVEDMRATLSAK